MYECLLDMLVGRGGWIGAGSWGVCLNERLSICLCQAFALDAR